MNDHTNKQIRRGLESQNKVGPQPRTVSGPVDPEMGSQGNQMGTREKGANKALGNVTVLTGVHPLCNYNQSYNSLVSHT